MTGLTHTQERVLAFVAATIAERGFPPTLKDVAAHVGARYTNGAFEHITALVKKGMLVKQPLIARGLTVTAKGHATLKQLERARSEEP